MKSIAILLIILLVASIGCTENKEIEKENKESFKLPEKVNGLKLISMTKHKTGMPVEGLEEIFFLSRQFNALYIEIAKYKIKNTEITVVHIPFDKNKDASEFLSEINVMTEVIFPGIYSSRTANSMVVPLYKSKATLVYDREEPKYVYYFLNSNHFFIVSSNLSDVYAKILAIEIDSCVGEK